VADRTTAKDQFTVDATVNLNRTSLRLIHTPRSLQTLVAFSLCVVLGITAFLTFVPWLQTVVGSGIVTSFAPEARPQTVNSLITGRIIHWNVMEGASVKKGDTLVLLQDINIGFFDTVITDRLSTLRDRTVSAQQAAIDVSHQRRQQAEQRLTQAQARYDNAIIELQIARTRLDRSQQLFSEDLVSKRDVETATRDFQKAIADSAAGYASVLASEQDVAASRNEEARAIAQADVFIQEADVRLANVQGRVLARTVIAPIDGTVVRIARAGPGQIVKEGDELAVIVPKTTDQAVEIYMSSMDAALVEPGRKVALQFSGFPAFQFSGWQDIAVGIFHGTVKVIDAVDDGTGSFRVLVVPDTTYDYWPDQRFLRQGTDVTGWILLSEVPVGYELWRQLMGFPPQFPVPDSKSRKEKKERMKQRGDQPRSATSAAGQQEKGDKK
jgi:adhesin transport system membrane fusion protein